MDNRLAQLESQLTFLATTLKEELSHSRQPQAASECADCSVLRSSIAAERVRYEKLVHRVTDMETDLEGAGDLIESLKGEIKKETTANAQLRGQIEVMNKEINSLKSKVAVSPVASSGNSELDAEKRRRLRAEAELDAYRRQTKGTDSTTTMNAKRVAITLARHCLELSDELAKLRDTKPASISVPADVLKTAIFQPSVPTVSAKSGWDADDDDLFADLK